MRKFFASLLLIFITKSVMANYVCDTDISEYFAKYELNTHTCPVGYYLPANIDGCRACPTGFTCPGGTFTFNTNEYQGLQIGTISNNTLTNACAVNFPKNFDAVYVRNQHTCAAGQYMPANYDGCQTCPENNYCPGGTYTFNETDASGATPCPAGTVAPPGMSSVEQCGRKLHLGPDTLYLRSQRRTNPSLNFDTDGDGVADFFANVTTADTIMSATATQKFKIKVGETIYSICDDTVMP